MGNVLKMLQQHKKAASGKSSVVIKSDKPSFKLDDGVPEFERTYFTLELIVHGNSEKEVAVSKVAEREGLAVR
jgi:hypothetical protein